MISIYRKFFNKIIKFRERAESIYAWPSTNPHWEFNYLSFSLLSDIWQNWCKFCREVILKSCIGTKTRSGTIIQPRTSLNSWQRIAYEVNQASRGRAIDRTSTITFMRHEPTWGDIDLLLAAIPRLSLSNTNNLLTGFGLSLIAPRHIQVVRNACAHINSESMQQVQSLMVNYIGTDLKNPIDLMWWLEPVTKTDAIFFWLDELEIIVDYITS
jgi:hypothetical protein